MLTFQTCKEAKYGTAQRQLDTRTRVTGCQTTGKLTESVQTPVTFSPMTDNICWASATEKLYIAPV